MTKRRVVVLGANGFIGRRLIDSLSEVPDVLPVAGVRRPPATPFPSGVQTVCLDATDVAQLLPLLEGASGTINCVAGSAFNITAGAKALTVALGACTGPPPRLVHLSSLAVYGTAVGSVHESAPLLGDLDAYSAAKAAAEAILQPVRNRVILRPGIVYGPGSPLWSAHIGRLLLSGRLGDLGDGGQGICNLVHVQDVITAIRRGLSLPKLEGQAFNLAMDDAPTWNEYFRAYALALGSVSRRIPPWRLTSETLVLAPILKALEMLARSKASSVPPAIRPWLLTRCAHPIRMDVTAAETSLQMVWEPLEGGLAATANWFRSAISP